MTISFDDYRNRTHTRDPAAGQQRIRELQASIHEAVRATAVTGHAEWDHFLELIEGRIAKYRDMIAVEQSALVAPGLVNSEQIMLLKVRLACLQTALCELEAVIALPKILIAGGSEAASMLATLDVHESEVA